MCGKVWNVVTSSCHFIGTNAARCKSGKLEKRGDWIIVLVWMCDVIIPCSFIFPAHSIRFRRLQMKWCENLFFQHFCVGGVEEHLNIWSFLYFRIISFLLYSAKYHIDVLNNQLHLFIYLFNIYGTVFLVYCIYQFLLNILLNIVHISFCYYILFVIFFSSFNIFFIYFFIISLFSRRCISYVPLNFPRGETYI